ncbi:unnamed protein product [Citrullus colocynthis]|uniref:CHORD domain-containing protein n=1 Tax=Citrullus colocynthis TaxID=252529 RepID=A0ABP0Z2P7_9ROSI
MEHQIAGVRCQRIGCNASFTEDDNPEGSCQYHDSVGCLMSTMPEIELFVDKLQPPGIPKVVNHIADMFPWSMKGPFLPTKLMLVPIFHDGMKEWSCCKKRSHDFSLFLEIPGCKTGKHTTEKPVLTKPTTAVKKPSPTPVSSMSNTFGKESCARCQQGFFCSDHGTQVKGNNKSINEASIMPAASNTDSQVPPAPAKKIIGINEPQICKNKGCGKTFTEMENHDTACIYHPGPAIFRDRLRGWKCCNIHLDKEKQLWRSSYLSSAYTQNE